MLTTIAIEGYRSIRRLVMPLTQMTVITGANGSGKSSLYRALRLIAETAHDGVVRAIATEGGLASSRWAGPETISRGMRAREVKIQGLVREHAHALKLGFAGDDLGYAVDFGQPVAGGTFGEDPEIKAEAIWHGPVYRRSAAYAERTHDHVRIRRDDDWHVSEHHPEPWSSILSEMADAVTAPEVLVLRRTLRAWRFYDQLRTDPDAPARHPAVGTRTPVLASDGHDLAAAIATIRDMSGSEALDAAIDHAFPGSTVAIDGDLGRWKVVMYQRGLLRPLEAGELSDGTLRFLLLVAALLSPRPASLLVLNEPETSLHPQLVDALASLIVAASARSQIIVVSHSAALVAALSATGGLRHELVRDTSETMIAGQSLVQRPAWHWPMRAR